MRDPEKLLVFDKAHALVIAVYRMTALFPSEEKFHLTSQIRRAAVSIPSNVVEGCSRESEADFRRFIEIALGSAMELRYQLGLAYDLSKQGLLAIADPEGMNLLTEQAFEVVRMLSSLGKTLRSKSS